MFLFDLKNAWEDYKYYVVVVAILIVLLLVVTISCIVSASKKKKSKKSYVAEAAKEIQDSNAEDIVEESVEEETPIVEESVEEETPEAEEQVEEETPVVEESVEEETKVVEEQVEEETKVVEEPKKVAPKKKAAAKKTPATKVVTLAEKAPVVEEKVEETPAVQETPVVEESKKEEKTMAKTPVAAAPAKKAPAKTKTIVKGKYEIVPDADGFKYILKASNGESLIVSENYTTVSGCKNAIKRLKENTVDAEIKIEQDKKKNFQFHVVRGTRIVAHSANYSTKISAVNASNSFLKFVNSEKIEVVEATDDIAQPELVDLSNANISTEKTGKIVIYQENDFLLYRLIANNGQVICMSPTYKTMSTIKNSIAKFQEAVYNGKFYLIQDKNGNFQFKLYSAANRLIMTGESFNTKDTCRSNVESCYRFAKNAIIEDITNA